MNGDGKAISICNIGVTRIMYNNRMSFAFTKDDILLSNNIKPLDINVSTINSHTIQVNTNYKVNSVDLKPFEIKVKDKTFSKNAILEPCNISVESISVVEKDNMTDKLTPLNIFVDTIIPPTNSSNSNGDGLKSFKIVTQKNNYFEFRLNLEDNSVVNITGLPYGVSYVDGVLKGSAQISGEFLITVTLSNNSTINGILIISQLPRKF